MINDVFISGLPLVAPDVIHVPLVGHNVVKGVSNYLCRQTTLSGRDSFGKRAPLSPDMAHIAFDVLGVIEKDENEKGVLI